MNGDALLVDEGATEKRRHLLFASTDILSKNPPRRQDEEAVGGMGNDAWTVGMLDCKEVVVVVDDDEKERVESSNFSNTVLTSSSAPSSSLLFARSWSGPPSHRSSSLYQHSPVPSRPLSTWTKNAKKAAADDGGEKNDMEEGSVKEDTLSSSRMRFPPLSPPGSTAGKESERRTTQGAPGTSTTPHDERCSSFSSPFSFSTSHMPFFKPFASRSWFPPSTSSRVEGESCTRRLFPKEPTRLSASPVFSFPPSPDTTSKEEDAWHTPCRQGKEATFSSVAVASTSTSVSPPATSPYTCSSSSTVLSSPLSTGLSSHACRPLRYGWSMSAHVDIPLSSSSSSSPFVPSQPCLPSSLQVSSVRETSAAGLDDPGLPSPHPSLHRVSPVSSARPFAFTSSPFSCSHKPVAKDAAGIASLALEKGDTTLPEGNVRADEAFDDSQIKEPKTTFHSRERRRATVSSTPQRYPAALDKHSSRLTGGYPVGNDLPSCRSSPPFHKEQWESQGKEREAEAYEGVATVEIAPGDVILIPILPDDDIPLLSKAFLKEHGLPLSMQKTLETFLVAQRQAWRCSSYAAPATSGGPCRKEKKEKPQGDVPSHRVTFALQQEGHEGKQPEKRRRQRWSERERHRDSSPRERIAVCGLRENRNQRPPLSLGGKEASSDGSAVASSTSCPPVSPVEGSHPTSASHTISMPVEWTSVRPTRTTVLREQHTRQLQEEERKKKQTTARRRRDEGSRAHTAPPRASFSSPCGAVAMEGPSVSRMSFLSDDPLEVTPFRESFRNARNETAHRGKARAASRSLDSVPRGNRRKEVIPPSISSATTTPKDLRTTEERELEEKCTFHPRINRYRIEHCKEGRYAAVSARRSRKEGETSERERRLTPRGTRETASIPLHTIKRKGRAPSLHFSSRASTPPRRAAKTAGIAEKHTENVSCREMRDLPASSHTARHGMWPQTLPTASVLSKPPSVLSPFYASFQAGVQRERRVPQPRSHSSPSNSSSIVNSMPSPHALSPLTSPARTSPSSEVSSREVLLTNTKPFSRTTSASRIGASGPVYPFRNSFSALRATLEFMKSRKDQTKGSEVGMAPARAPPTPSVIFGQRRTPLSRAPEESGASLPPSQPHPFAPLTGEDGRRHQSARIWTAVVPCAGGKDLAHRTEDDPKRAHADPVSQHRREEECIPSVQEYSPNGLLSYSLFFGR